VRCGLPAPAGLRAAAPRLAPRGRGGWLFREEQAAVLLLYRYPPGRDYDGLEGRENLFAVCSFWLADYLARSGEVDRAMILFERLLGLANDVGLYAEQFDTRNHLALGNIPQAFSHSGAITAALSIDQALRGRPGHQIAA